MTFRTDRYRVVELRGSSGEHGVKTPHFHVVDERGRTVQVVTHGRGGAFFREDGSWFAPKKKYANGHLFRSYPAQQYAQLVADWLNAHGARTVQTADRHFAWPMPKVTPEARDDHGDV